jgi:hypothetical protein
VIWGSFQWREEPELPQWDPKPVNQTASIPGVDCSLAEQGYIEQAARRMHDNRDVAAEMAREKAGYAGFFDANGNIV